MRRLAGLAQAAERTGSSSGCRVHGVHSVDCKVFRVQGEGCSGCRVFRVQRVGDQTRNPKPKIQNPKPEPRSSNPETRNPKTEARSLSSGGRRRRQPRRWWRSRPIRSSTFGPSTGLTLISPSAHGSAAGGIHNLARGLITCGTASGVVVRIYADSLTGSTCGPISPCSGRKCLKSLRSSYTGLYPRTPRFSGIGLRVEELGFTCCVSSGGGLW